MKKQHNPLTRFIVGLAVLWWQQATLLVERIRNLPQNREAMKQVVSISITLVIVFGVGALAIDLSRCPNCKVGLGGPHNRHLHQHTCKNCEEPYWACPNQIHSHKKICVHCRNWYWDCPDGPSQESEHGSTICKPLHERLSPPAGHRFKPVPGALPLRNNKKESALAALTARQ